MRIFSDHSRVKLSVVLFGEHHQVTLLSVYLFCLLLGDVSTLENTAALEVDVKAKAGLKINTKLEAFNQRFPTVVCDIRQKSYIFYNLCSLRL